MKFTTYGIELHQAKSNAIAVSVLASDTCTRVVLGMSPMHLKYVGRFPIQMCKTLFFGNGSYTLNQSFSHFRSMPILFNVHLDEKHLRENMEAVDDKLLNLFRKPG